MTTSLVPVTTLSTEIGPFTEAEASLAEAFLTEASDLAREIGLARWTEPGGPYPAPISVRLAVKRAARRAMNEDPDGFSQESLGDWSGSKARTSSDESGVFFTAQDEARIRKAAGFRASGVGSIRTPSAYRSESTGTAYVVAGETPLPFLDEEDLP